MKKKILVLMLALSSLMAKAQQKQNIEYYRSKIFKNCSLIVEGTSVSHSRVTENTGHEHNVHKISITKVLKGNQNLVGNTIFVLNGYQNSSHHELFSDGPEKKIVFCEAISDTNTIAATLAYSGIQKIRYSITIDETREDFPINGGGYENFKSRAELYNYLKQFRELTIKADAPKRIGATRIKSLSETEKQDSIRKEAEQALRAAEWMNKLMERTRRGDSLNGAQKKSSMRLAKTDQIMAAGNLNIYLANQTVTVDGTGNRFLEFDMNFQVNASGLYFETSLISLNYNTSTFGSNINGAGKVTITKGSNFSIYDAEVFDNTSSKLRIFIGSNTKQCNRFLPPANTIINMYHIKIKYDWKTGCGENTGLAFTDAAVMPNITRWAETATATFHQQYNSITANSFTAISLPNNCTPTILPAGIKTGATNSLTALNGGVGDYITITGTGFGSTRGSGGVEFVNATDPSVRFYASDDDDYLPNGWSDTEIKVKIISSPSVVGSGTIKVKNNLDNISFSSDQSIDIKYSIKNLPYGTQKIRSNLAKVNCINGFEFTLSSTLQNQTSAIAAIEAALNTWKAALGIEMRLKRNSLGELIFVTASTRTQDNINLITTGTQGASSNGLMATSPWVTNWSNTTGTIFTYIKEVDIMIRPNSTYFGTGGNILVDYDYSTSGSINSSKQDFYGAFLHELGHGLGLEHVIQPVVGSNGQDLMNYALPKGSVRWSLSTGNGYALAGATNIRDASKQINWIVYGAKGAKDIQTLKDATYAAPTISGSPLTFCLGNSVNLTSATRSSYQWYRNGDPISSANAQSYLANESGNYSMDACAPYTVVNVLPLPSAAVSPAGPVSYCADGTSFTLTAPSGSGLSYQWFVNAGGGGGPLLLAGQTGQSLTYTKSISINGGYFVRVTDLNNCVNNTNPDVTVVVNSLPPAPATATNNGPLCLGGTLNLNCANVSGASYSWTGPSAYSASIQNPSIASFNAQKAGTYTVKSIRNGCTSASGRSTTIASPSCRVGFIGDEEVIYEISVSPNPAQDLVSIKLPFQEGESTIQITDMNGRILETIQTSKYEYEMNTSILTAGLYLLNINHNGMTDYKKLSIIR